MNKIAIRVFRVLMTLLIGVEVLNGMGVLHFSLVYTRQGLAIVALGAWVGAEIIIARKKRKKIHLPLLLTLIFVALLLDVSGDALHFYSSIPHYDKFLHFFNSGVITYVIFVVLKEKMQKANIDRFFSFVIVATVSSYLGILYEIEEFLEDVFINRRQIRLGDGFDTAGDLLANVLGCAIMAAIIFYVLKRKHRAEA